MFSFSSLVARFRTDMAPIYGLSGINQKLDKISKKINGQTIELPWPVLPAPLFYPEGPKASGDGSELVDDLKKRHEQGVQAVAQGLEMHLNMAMEASWGWIDGARDIVDSGDLKNSGKVGVMGDQIVVNYTSPYANLVHYGGYIYPYGNVNIEKVYLPARPWVDATLGDAAGPVQPFDWMRTYLEAVGY